MRNNTVKWKRSRNIYLKNVSPSLYLVYQIPEKVKWERYWQQHWKTKNLLWDNTRATKTLIKTINQSERILPRQYEHFSWHCQYWKFSWVVKIIEKKIHSNVQIILCVTTDQKNLWPTHISIYIFNCNAKSTERHINFNVKW